MVAEAGDWRRSQQARRRARAAKQRSAASAATAPRARQERKSWPSPARTAPPSPR
jgi:hypothetical protein